MNDLFTNVLRVHPEPCTYMDEAAVHRALVAAPTDYLSFVGDWLTLLVNQAAGLILPPKWICSDAPAPDSGDFRVMPCVVQSGDCIIKTVKIVGTNRRQRTVPDQITVGKAFHLHPHENFVTHVFEACLLSSARTGLCGALALSRLASNRTRVNIIGAGRVGYYAALYASALGGVEEMVFQDLQFERATSVASQLGPFCRAAKLNERVNADAVILATTASKAFFEPRMTQATAIISLGADTEDQHELSPEWASRADLYVDGPDCLKVGDARAWLHAGHVEEKDFRSLLELWRNGPRAMAAGPRIFISTGSALLDNLTIGYILDRKPARKPPQAPQTSVPVMI